MIVFEASSSSPLGSCAGHTAAPVALAPPTLAGASPEAFGDSGLDGAAAQAEVPAPNPEAVGS